MTTLRLFLCCLLGLITVTCCSNSIKKKALDQAKELNIKDVGTLEAIVAIHAHLDDDRNGNVDINETHEFLREELHVEGDFNREETLHAYDKYISVADLWKSWIHNEARNWTTSDIIFWLEWSVGLPEYASIFQEKEINGSILPALATNHQNVITSVLGIKDLHHRQKITLRAMDTVLFGPPAGTNLIKDGIVAVSLIIVVIAVIYTNFQQRTVRKQKERMQKMFKDVQALRDIKLEHNDTLEELKKATKEHENHLAERQNVEERLKKEVDIAKAEAERLKKERECSEENKVKLKLAEEELKQVREALERVEQELEYKSWNPPVRLQELLSTCFQVEEQFYISLESETTKQLQQTVEESEKIQKMYKKRTTLLGTVRTVHGHQMSDVERKILRSRKALEEYRNSMEEKSQRWDEIELICGFGIRDVRVRPNSVSKVKSRDRYSLDTGRLAHTRDPIAFMKQTDDTGSKSKLEKSESCSSNSSGNSQTESTDCKSTQDGSKSSFRSTSDKELLIKSESTHAPVGTRVGGFVRSQLSHMSLSQGENLTQRHAISLLQRTSSQDSCLPGRLPRKTPQGSFDGDTESIHSTSNDDLGEKKKKKRFKKKIFK